MKIKVFTIIDESWDSGNLNSTDKKFFISEELRDDYFEFLRKDYLKNRNLEEYETNSFCEKTSRQRWAYHIEKVEEELEIIEEKNW